IFPVTSIQVDDPSVYDNLDVIVTNASGKVPLHTRFRAIFTLKNIGDERSVDILAKAFNDESDLLKHELAYVLGQMKNSYANPILRQVLSDKSQDPMIRHEAAEGLGAIGDLESLDILEKYLDDEHQVVRQTCELAIAKIKYEHDSQKSKDSSNSKFTSIDPAPPISEIQSVPKLKKILFDETLPIFDRYRAMFALRNIGTTEAVMALSEGLNDSSDLFRHEIAYVFGQLQSPDSVPSLIKTLENTDERPMVRHEAAEALGSIATLDCLPVLKKYRHDSSRVVKESCEVALDMYDYETSAEFHYADMSSFDTE
ncbi:2560_t:CDS:2, partial [Ambispora gerdemannii]